MSPRQAPSSIWRCGGEPLFVNFDARLENLVVERYQQRLPGDIADEIGTRQRGAAEGAAAKLTLLVAIKDDAHVLELDDVGGGLAAHHLDGVLIGEIIAAFDRVEGVRFPRVVLGDGGVDAALRGARVAADGVDFGNDGDVGAGARRFQRGPHAG